MQRIALPFLSLLWQKYSHLTTQTEKEANENKMNENSAISFIKTCNRLDDNEWKRK